MRHAVHVVHIVVKEFGGGGHRNDGLEFRRVPHGHLQRIEAAPGDAHHANVSVRPRLMRQPGDDLQAVELLLLRVLAAGGNAFAGAEAADIDAGTHVSAAHKVGIQFVVTLGGAVILPIRVILEDCREFLAGFAAIGHVQRDRQANSILHRNPCVLHADVVSGRGWRLDAESRGYHQPQQGYKKP